MRQLTRDQAIEFADKKLWESLTDVERFEFQHQQQLLCMPFSEFHRCAEVALSRPVWTHEFAKPELLWDEYLGGRDAPTFDEILSLIPENKRIVLDL